LIAEELDEEDALAQEIGEERRDPQAVAPIPIAGGWDFAF